MKQKELEAIKELIEQFLEKMTMRVFSVQTSVFLDTNKECVSVDVYVEDPQVLIGQNGQTLFELQRLLRIVLNKKISGLGQAENAGFSIDLDINDYKKKKIEYLKKMAIEAADLVVLTKEKKILPPMPSYERKIIHSELAQRQDVVTQSEGEGLGRCIVISPK